MRKLKIQYFMIGALTTIFCLLVFVLVSRTLHMGIGKVDVGDKAVTLEAYIDKYFWKEVDDEKLEAAALKGMMTALGDKYSAYYTEEEYKSVMEGIKGVYCGIGATIRQKGTNGAFIIVNTFADSPAKKAGLKENDIIVKVNGEGVEQLTLSELTAKVKGEEGTKVSLTVKRGKSEITCEVQRKEMTTISIDSKMLEGKIGYIDISEFDDATPTQFEQAIAKLKEEGAKGFIFDVRNNGGGSLTAVTAMLEKLLPEGLILSVRDKNGTREEYKSTNTSELGLPSAVLINGYSASASEVFAGALQDRGAAVLVGEKSFGKGIVQSIYSLENAIGGGAIKITTAEYFLPSGRSIHSVGLMPDVKVAYEGNKEEYREEDDNQLQAACRKLLEKE